MCCSYVEHNITVFEQPAVLVSITALNFYKAISKLKRYTLLEKSAIAYLLFYIADMKLIIYDL